VLIVRESRRCGVLWHAKLQRVVRTEAATGRAFSANDQNDRVRLASALPDQAQAPEWRGMDAKPVIPRSAADFPVGSARG